MIIAPCKNCPNRTVDCHSTCDKYKQYCIKNEERKATIRSAKQQAKPRPDGNYYKRRQV